MTLSQISGAAQSRRGPRPKGGQRLRIQVKMPEAIAEALTGLAAQVDQPVTDLGAYYLIIGLNQARLEAGLTPYPMPSYLEEAARRHATRELQDSLPEHTEESLLAG